MILMQTDWWQKPFLWYYVHLKGKTFLKRYIFFGCASDVHTSAKKVCLDATDLQQMLSAL